MTSLALLLEEIYKKDATFRIEEPRNGHIVFMENHDGTIRIEAEGFGRVIQRTWDFLYGGTADDTRRD